MFDISSPTTTITTAFVAHSPLAIRSNKFKRHTNRCTITRASTTPTSTSSNSSTTIPSNPKKTQFDITLLPGDGIGPEITSVTRKVLDAAASIAKISINYKEANVGGCAIDEEGVPLPKTTLEKCRNSDAVLLACIGGPKWDSNERSLRPESGLLSLRKELGLFANLRPAKVIPQLIDASTLKREIVQGVDLMVVRELTGDVYFGTPKGIRIDENTGKRVGYNNMIYEEHEIERIAKVAFQVARSRGGKLCSVDKANVLDVSQLWRDVIIECGESNRDVELSHMYVDNAAMQLIRYPKQFDTIVTGNIFGDILSDAASMLVGSLGMLPSASLGDSNTTALYEPVHGSAPDIAGLNLANPIACVLSAAMMARYSLHRPDLADCIERAVEDTLSAGYRTKDIAADGDLLVGCMEMGDCIVRNLK